MQIYFDFSGYSDMALGIAKLFGINIPINFNSPYKAANVAEFWRRWHITLSRWLRDYLYIPLGGNRKSIFRSYQCPNRFYYRGIMAWRCVAVCTLGFTAGHWNIYWSFFEFFVFKVQHLIT